MTVGKVTLISLEDVVKILIYKIVSKKTEFLSFQ